MFFRNLFLFRFDKDTATDLARLDEALPDYALRPVGALEMASRGFVPPIGRDESAPLTQDVGACTVFTAGGQDKLLPPAVLNEALQHKVQEIAEAEDRRVGGRERKRLKEDLLTEMLPRAFTRSSRISAYVDKANGWLVIDTSSRKVAENTVTLLREALGSFPVVPMAPNESPRVLMTDWLATDNLPAGFALGDECELRDPATTSGATAVCRRQDMDAEEVKEHLRNGKQVYKLGLVFDDRISFVLGEDLIVRKLRFLDVVQDELGDSEDSASEALATFTLMTLELQRLFTQLETIFGLHLDAPLHLHKQDAPAGMSSLQGAAKKLANSFRNSVGPGGSVTISGGGKSVTINADQVIDPHDGMYEMAVETVRTTGKASISLVQRELRIGYNRAARLIETMELARIVSAPQGDGTRVVLLPYPT